MGWEERGREEGHRVGAGQKTKREGGGGERGMSISIAMTSYSTLYKVYKITKLTKGERD